MHHFKLQHQPPGFLAMENDSESHSLLAPTQEHLSSVQVFSLLPNMKKDVMNNIDAALTWEQLTASDINFALVRPLVLKYAKLHNLAVVYASLVVRSHFLSLANSNMAHSSLMGSRAALCELLAMKLLRHFASNRIELVAVLTTSWNPLAGAPPDVISEVREELGGRNHYLSDPTSALEMAIATKSKTFLSSTLAQSVVNSIYSGSVVFSSVSHRGLLMDNYKPRPIEIYDCRKAPFLDHYRLRVPRYSAILEFLNFAMLLSTFVLCLSNQNFEKLMPSEIVFIIFAFAFALAEYTVSSNGGWSMYIMNMWNVFDTSFILIFLTYFVLRVKGLATNDVWTSELGFNILACGACILFPRLAFFAVSNNVIVLALRGMIFEFILFMAIAGICFSGLLFTLWTLASDKYSVGSIAWLMVEIWFGNTILSFERAKSFHPVFGPLLMTIFAALSNTLLLTILISILSSTFARIDANATQEYLFQFSITTIENVKSDALFSYQLPFNLLAYALLLPLSWVLSPRALHSANVFLIKLTSFPTLICIGIYERYFARGQRLRETSRDAVHSIYVSLPRQLKNMPIVAIMGHKYHDLYQAIFDVDLSHEYDIFAEDSEDDVPALRSARSSESMKQVLEASASSNSAQQVSSLNIRTPSAIRSLSVPQSPTSPTIRDGSPRRRKDSAPQLQTGDSSFSLLTTTPLSKLFGASAARSRPPSIAERDVFSVNGEEVVASVKRLESLMEGLRDLPVQRLKDEMKELQDRQARIENLLLMLTRGMRHDTGHPPSSLARHETK